MAAAIPAKNGTNGWSVALFETYRPLLTEFVKTKIQPHIDSDEVNRILIRVNETIGQLRYSVPQLKELVDILKFFFVRFASR